MASHLLHKQVSNMAFKSSFIPTHTKLANVKAPSRTQRRAVKVLARQHEVDVGLFGTKAGMMSWFTSDGLCVPATVIALEPGNIVTQIKTEETDGYNAVQIGYKVVAERKVSKPELGHLVKGGVPPVRHLREFKLKDKKRVESFSPGQQLQVADMVKEGDLLDVAGTSIGKGFQGTIKRYNFKRGSMTHGSKSHREHGSLGPGTTPGRVFPGTKMAGRMGGERVKVRKLQVLKVDPERSALVLKGCVPGKPGNVVEITTAKVVGWNFKAGTHY